MPIQPQVPANDLDRLAALEKIIAAGQEDHSQGRLFLSTDILEYAEALAHQFQVAQSALTDALAAKNEAEKVAAANISALQEHVKAIWAYAREQVTAGNLERHLLPHYQLGVDGSAPLVHTQTEWSAVSASILKRANSLSSVEAALSPLLSTLESSWEKTKLSLTTASPAVEKYEKIYRAVTDLRSLLNEQIHEVRIQLLFTLRHDEYETKAEVLSHYGYTLGSREEVEATTKLRNQPALPPARWHKV